MHDFNLIIIMSIASSIGWTAAIYVDDDLPLAIGYFVASAIGAFAASYLTLWFLLMVSGYVYPVVWSFYGKEQFGWDLKTIGLTLAGYGAFLIVVQGFVVGPTVKWLGERRVIHLGNFVTISGLIVLVIADQPWMVFALLPVLALGDISGPAIEGYMSNIVDETEQGDLRGIFASIEAMAAIASPPIMAGLFFAFTSNEKLPYLPSAPFLMAAVFAAAAAFIFQFSLVPTSAKSD